MTKIVIPHRVMRRMYNIVIHDPENGSFGDCHRNCIAMLLGLDQHKVPHFFREDDGEVGRQECKDFLKKFGLAEANVLFTEETSIESILRHTKHMMPGVPCILGGQSRNNCNHSVVVYNGEIWCDPSGGGIIGPMLNRDEGERYYWLTFLASVPSAVSEEEVEVVEKDDSNVETEKEQTVNAANGFIIYVSMHPNLTMGDLVESGKIKTFNSAHMVGNMDDGTPVMIVHPSYLQARLQGIRIRQVKVMRNSTLSDEQRAFLMSRNRGNVIKDFITQG